MSRRRTGLPRRGQTFYQGTTPPTSWTESASAEGTVVIFKDADPTNNEVGGDALRSNKDVTCVLVRNVAGTTLSAKRLVSWKSGSFGRRVDGYCDLNYDPNVAGVVDEHLSSGIPANDMGWIVVEGPTYVLTPIGADGTNVIDEGDRLVALTAANSTANTESGRIQSVDTVATSNATTNMYIALNVIGQALSAKTTGNTNVDCLCHIQLMKA